MKRVLILFVLACLVGLIVSCDSDDDDAGGGPANPAFNGTFSGSGTRTFAAGQDPFDMVMTLSVSSPLSGDFSVGGDATGTISGDASGNSATFDAAFSAGGGKCTGSFSGTMDLIQGTLVINASGEDSCDGAFELTADLEATVCGNRILEPGEECDDGNTDPGDGCDEQCLLEGGSAVCGNGVLEKPEECDDGNTDPGDGCSATCTDEGTTCGAGCDCCEDNGTPGCSNQAIEDCVCALDAFCCNTTWDQVCADEVTSKSCGTCV